MLRLGIDVGQSSTEAVLMDEDSLVYIARQLTTADVLTGIDSVLTEVLAAAEVPVQNIQAVMFGSDYCYRALHEQNQLAKVGSIRICQSTGSIPPLFEAADSFRAAIGLSCLELTGGHEVDGSLSSTRLLCEQLAPFLPHAGRVDDIEAVAVTSTFSLVNDSNEQAVKSWIQENYGETVRVSLSHEIGNIGFIERENATILNAALSKPFIQVLEGVSELLQKYSLIANKYVSQNDGSLTSYDYARRYPIRTLQSRVASSFLGAAFLTKWTDCIIVHVEPEAVHIGVLLDGFPKVAWQNHQVVDVNVSVPMPAVVTIPTQMADQGAKLLDKVYQVVEKFQPRYERLPIVFVGEGSTEIFKQFKYPWADVVQPTFFRHASAIGTCMAPVSGSVNRMYWLDQMDKEATIASAVQEAVVEAIRAGADPETVVIQSINTTPLAYIPSQALQVQIKAVGSLRRFSMRL